MEYHEKPKPDSTVDREALDRAKPVDYRALLALSKKVHYAGDPYIGLITEDQVPNMDGYASRDTVAFMRPGSPRSALRPVGDSGVPYMWWELSRVHELVHHKRHAKCEPQNEEGPHSVNDEAAYSMDQEHYRQL